MRISVNYSAKWQIKDKPNYVWTVCKKLVNINTGREIKKTLKGMTAGYWIGKNFFKLNDLRDKVELIPKQEKLPF